MTEIASAGRRLARRFLPLFGLVVLAGCGPSQDGPVRVPVAGAVSLDGAPLGEGFIRFVPIGETKGPAAVGPIKEGVYKLSLNEGPVAGTHRVEIEATGHQDFEVDDERAYAERFEKTKSPPFRPNPIPPAYNRRSQLTAKLTAEGSSQLDFALSSRPSGANAMGSSRR
jgi:hypothetical protein